MMKGIQQLLLLLCCVFSYNTSVVDASLSSSSPSLSSLSSSLLSVRRTSALTFVHQPSQPSQPWAILIPRGGAEHISDINEDEADVALEEVEVEQDEVNDEDEAVEQEQQDEEEAGVEEVAAEDTEVVTLEEEKVEEEQEAEDEDEVAVEEEQQEEEVEEETEEVNNENEIEVEETEETTVEEESKEDDDDVEGDVEEGVEEEIEQVTTEEETDEKEQEEDTVEQGIVEETNEEIQEVTTPEDDNVDVEEQEEVEEVTPQVENANVEEQEEIQEVTTPEEDGINNEQSVLVEEEDEASLIFGASKDGDGSESDPDGIPSRFLRMQKNNRSKAKSSFATTVNWRKDHEVDTILQRPHPKYDLCKRIFPVYIPGRDVSNNLVVVQRVGKIDFELSHKNNITGDDLLMNYVYIVEYCWHILEPGPPQTPGPEGVMTTIMDLKDVNFKSIDVETRKFLKKFVKMMSDHYPQRSHRTLIINAPSWVKIMYNFVKPLLRESTRRKITILNGGKKQDKTLIKILGKGTVPRNLLIRPDSIDDDDDDNDDQNKDDKDNDGSVSEIEVEMRLFCLKQLEKYGVAMQDIIEIDE